MNYSPLLRVHSPPPQPCHKVCDVEYSSSMKGQSVLSQADRAVLCGAPPPAATGPALKDLLWPEESSGMERLLRKCHIRNQLARECMAECLGVYVLIVSIQLIDLNLKHKIYSNQSQFQYLVSLNI